MNLKTKRLTLRLIDIHDVSNIHQLHSIAEVDQYNTLGIPDSYEVTNKLVSQWIKLQNEIPQLKYVLCIENFNLQFVGLIGINIGKPGYFNAEIWYKFHPNFWNQGYATEVVEEVLKYCFNVLKLHRVEAGCATENKASIRVLEKCGFIKEALRRKLLPIRGAFYDNYEYAILEEDFDLDLQNSNAD